MSNFRQTKDCNNCTKCVFFTSWRSFMGDDDPFEPSDSGFCENELNIYPKGHKFEGDDLACDSSEICDLFEK